MTKKKTEKKKEFDYAEFTIKFSKLCIKLSILFTKILYSSILFFYHKLDVWLAWKQLKTDIHTCAVCRDECWTDWEY